MIEKVKKVFSFIMAFVALFFGALYYRSKKQLTKANSKAAKNIYDKDMVLLNEKQRLASEEADELNRIYQEMKKNEKSK